jgi:hypothetical protein
MLLKHYSFSTDPSTEVYGIIYQNGYLRILEKGLHDCKASEDSRRGRIERAADQFAFGVSHARLCDECVPLVLHGRDH